MFLGGLKLQIAGTLAVLLTVAILLGNIVVIAFWQKGVVRSEIKHTRQVLKSIAPLAGSNDSLTWLKSPDKLQTICGYISNRCVGVVFSDGTYWFKRSDSASMQAKSQNLTQKAITLKRGIIRFEENTWGFLSFKKRYLFIAEPFHLVDRAGLQSVVVIIELDSIYNTIFKNQSAIFVYWLVNVLFLTIIGFFRIIAITVKPIERMARMTTSYHNPDAMFFSGEEKRNEVGQLSMALNGMLYRIESDREKLVKTITSLEKANAELVKTQQEMIRTEKIASVGRLSAGLAHEIGNPIGIVQGYVELLGQSDLNESDRQQFAERALSELDRINTLIRQLLDYAGSSTSEMSIVNVEQLFSEISHIIAFQKCDPPISVIMDIPTDIFIECDGQSLRQVFLNCLLNALDAIESNVNKSGGKIRITVAIVKCEGGQINVHISLEDNGIGIKDRDIKAIFDPFFTTKSPGKGTGLGLFVSHSIIDAHGGKIWIDSIWGKGSIVHIELPLYTRGVQSQKMIN